MRRVLALLALLTIAAVPAGAAERLDYAGVALNILPPGQSGSLDFPATATDQLALYDALTARRTPVTDRELGRYFKSARFGGTGRTTRPRAGLRIVRDRWGVPHVYGRTRRDVAFGAGWVTAEDRGLLMNLLRGPGRIAALDVPGLDAFALATSTRTFVPSALTELTLAAQVELLRATADGRAVLADVDAYVAGINAFNRAIGYDLPAWTRNDVVAVAALIGAVFGVGGGDEARAAQFLSALQRRLGVERGRGVWEDLRALDDPESYVSVPGRVPYDTATRSGAGNAPIDAGSLQAAPPAQRRQMSNALLIGRARSASGRPLFVAGPQTGHSYPQILMELDLHGGGIDARGAAFPGISFYVLIGRGRDFAWSATSANLDLVDHYAEELCGGDDLHYLYQGTCRAMEVFDAGTLSGPGGAGPIRKVEFRTTVHGPVVGYATSAGRRVAISSRRSTRGREVLSARFFAELNRNRVRDVRSFLRAAGRMELTFNWLYADDRDIAQFTSGRLPIRHSAVQSGLPTIGTGAYEWRGFVPPTGHPQTVNPAGGVIVNWNNRPAHGTAASDDAFSWGSVQRAEVLAAGIADRRRHTLGSVVTVMNRAATLDLRALEVWPGVAAVLATGPAPTERAAELKRLVDEWRGSRLDADLDGKIDEPGAAIMDAAWPKLADAVLAPVLGPLVADLAALEGRHNRPSNGNAFGSGWYGYVDKDLRTLLGGPPVRGAYSTRYCGAGDLAACRASLWAALDAAGAELAAAQGPDPTAWRADATAERTRFGFLPRTARFANRPTFQQVVTFTGHRPRR